MRGGLPISHITTQALPYVRSAATLDSHRSTNRTVNCACEQSRLHTLYENLMPDTLILQEEKGATEDEMVGWYHPHNGHELEQTPGDSGRQGSLVCCSPQDSKESDTT